MDPKNFTHICTYRTKFYRMTAAVSLAACTCALGLPSAAFAANQTPAASAPTSTPASTASSTPAPAPVPSSAPVVTTPHASAPASPETPAQPKDDSLTWTRDDFNISADGKTIGGRKNVYHPETNQTVNEYVDGLSAKGKEKLKKNHQVVIPEGIEVIHECAFTGHAKKVGNKHEHIEGETYIEGVTLPQSLRIIEYGAFGWNKIKGTVTIPKNMVAVSDAAFVANEIEKVVFEGVLDDKGKEHETDAKPYYLAGVGSVAFQGNKISEIVVKGNLGQYKFRSGENDSPFDNQNPGPFTIEVGEEYKSPIKVTQESSGHKISVMEGFEENGNPAPIAQSPYFKKNADGKYVAIKTGTLEGQCIFYDFVQGVPRMIGRSRFTYNILPKSKICTVTFVNGTDQNYAKVQVKENKSIKDKSIKDQVMPADPTKASFTFMGWNFAADGSGAAFSADTTVTKDLNVYAYFKNFEPTLEVKGASITEGDSLDLKSLVISATDKEDGDLKDAVQVKNTGGFDSAKAGTYTVTFEVTDKGGMTTTKAATVTVKPKPKPEPEPKPKPEPTPNPTPTPYPLPAPEVPAPTPAPAPESEHKVPPLEAPAPKAPAAPADAPAPVARKHARALPQTGDPMAISAVGELGMMLGILSASLAATLRRKRR